LEQKQLYKKDHLPYIKIIIKAFRMYGVRLTENQAYISYNNWSEHNYCASWENGLEFFSPQRIVSELKTYIPQNKLKYLR
jgi:hypothetical protein